MSNLSSTAWLCAKPRPIQTEGREGTLSFDGQTISFVSKDGAGNLCLPVSNLKQADMNNIMGEGQIIFRTTDGQEHVFVFYPPRSVKKTMFMSLFYPRGYKNYLLAHNLSRDLAASKQWKDNLSAALPADKVLARKEVHVGRVILLGVAVPVIIIGVLVTLAVIFYG